MSGSWRQLALNSAPGGIGEDKKTVAAGGEQPTAAPDTEQVDRGESDRIAFAL